MGTAGGINDGTAGSSSRQSASSISITTAILAIGRYCHHLHLADRHIQRSEFEARLQYILTDTSGSDTITTGAGNDIINSNGGSDSINAGAGGDTVNINAGTGATSWTIDLGAIRRRTRLSSATLGRHQ